MLQGREEPGREKRAERRNVGEELAIERIDLVHNIIDSSPFGDDHALELVSLL